MTTNPCVHHWEIDAKNVGTCQKCGEVVQFPTLQEIDGVVSQQEYRSTANIPKPIILKPGRVPVEQKEQKTQPIHRGRWPDELREELREIGVDAFCEKYGYLGHAKNAVVRVWNKLAGAKSVRIKSKRDRAVSKTESPAGARSAKGQPTDRHLPEIVQAAVNKLPPQGAFLDKQRLDTLKLMMVCALDLGYGE